MPALRKLYEKLWDPIADFSRLTGYAEPLHGPVQQQILRPMEAALFACHDAIKAIKPERGRQTEERAALLYQHALRFDGPDNERRQILAGAMLAIPIPKSFKSETIRFRKSKFGEGGELYTVKDGDKIFWRQWDTSQAQTPCGEGLRPARALLAVYSKVRDESGQLQVALFISSLERTASST